MQTGNYYLSGVMEVASVFSFHTNGAFDFFFSYGAVDRQGRGTWEQRGDTILLTSPPKPATDFVLQEGRVTDDEELVIQITDPNVQVLRFVTARIKTLSGYETVQADEQGRIVLPRQLVEEIGLLHELWPDRPSFFPILDPAANYFVFTIDPRITEVEFRDLALRVEDEALTGGHPLLEGSSFRYNREPM